MLNTRPILLLLLVGMMSVSSGVQAGTETASEKVNVVVVSVRGSADGSKDPQQALQRVAPSGYCANSVRTHRD